MNQKQVNEFEQTQPWHVLVFAIVLVALVGCASQPHVESYVVPHTSCCSSVEEIDFRLVSLGQDLHFKITQSESSFTFADSRREQFVAFKIPDGFSASAIQVRSNLSTDFLPKATALIPDFIFFDAERRLITRVALDDLQEKGDFWGAAFAGRVSVPTHARYFAVVPGAGYGVNHSYRSENGNIHQIPAAALGELTIRIFGESESR